MVKLSTTQWRPKTTCDCIVQYTVDTDAEPPEDIPGLPPERYSFVSKCEPHSGLSDTALWAAIWDENPKWTRAYQGILDNGPPSLYDLDGTTRVLKPGITITGAMSGTAPNRVLTLTLQGITLTTPQKNAIKNWLDTRFGTGKVVLA